MEILLGKTAGTCGGVSIAIQNSERDLEKYKEVFCLGELVHNKDVINELEAKGLKIIDDISEAKERVIIRAHGIEKEVYDKAKRMNIELLDYTCKKVLIIHDLVAKYASEGYYIVLAGEFNHPEIIGTYSFCGEYKSIINKIEDVEKIVDSIVNSKCKKVLVVAQTTFNGFKFDEISEKIKSKLLKYNIETTINRTICNATSLRQNETVDLAKTVDLMIIIGGKNSSNTAKLYDIAKSNCKEAILVENYKEINKNFVKNYEKIGIMAGASTPKKVIDKVISYIEE